MKSRTATKLQRTFSAVTILAILFSAFPAFPASAATRWGIALNTNSNLGSGLVGWWTLDAGSVSGGTISDTDSPPPADMPTE